jgi:glyoxylase-like metal-dependent hydrolase (beta-lactamase superfamily II)
LILQRVEHPQFLSNAYLVIDEPGGHGVLIDGNGEVDPLLERVERERIEITHILLTHHHGDHAMDTDRYKDKFGVPVVAHEQAAELLGNVDETIGEGDSLTSGGLEIEAIHTPGHCADHLALMINGTDCVTADVLFKGTVGGTRAPGATGFEDLKHSVMEKLMTLEHSVRIHPGHKQPSTIGDEWEENPCVRIWRGEDLEGSELCKVGEEDATLVLWAPDYDGGNKAWVRFESGEQAVVGGSQVTREGED